MMPEHSHIRHFDGQLQTCVKLKLNLVLAKAYVCPADFA